MKKVTLLLGLIMAMPFALRAQTYTDSFDTNSLEWTENAAKKSAGTAIIDKGVLTITSKGEKEGMSALLSAASGVKTKVGQNLFFETHCYAPLDIIKPFIITAHARLIKDGDDEGTCGMMINYRDGGNFYTFVFNKEIVYFRRFEDDILVGEISKNLTWKPKKVGKSGAPWMEWKVEYDGAMLDFSIDGVPLLKIKYMPLSYDGFGFYSFGGQVLEVDDVAFTQL